MQRRRKAGWYKAGWSMASFLAVSLGAIPAHAWTGDTRFQVEFETGAVWQSRNEIHIPDSLQTGHGSIFGSYRGAVRKFSGGWTSMAGLHAGQRHRRGCKNTLRHHGHLVSHCRLSCL